MKTNKKDKVIYNVEWRGTLYEPNKRQWNLVSVQFRTENAAINYITSNKDSSNNSFYRIVKITKSIVKKFPRFKQL